eukprot:jgi/Tetstr1/427292/TSEL_017461.t1
MSKVASMYLQVGEAERRAAERAVVDNMKEAYVSVLAPSKLGVGIPAGDSMLIHGVRLIAEKLGPRAVIVHTYLRNAYNEAWRRTIIQRHIDCSPLHPVIPALLASLSTDSYLVVDDRSAPLRSEDGVQHGAPLAATCCCVAIYPEVQQCDTTLEVNDGAARFNADDGFLVGLPEHVWPALHAFRTSIKASVGLEQCFDKMQAYSANMEAARREAPADIEWPELDGHHGIAVLNVPFGSPEYVQAYMRGKAEELQQEVDASLSKLLSAKPSRRYTHALHHHAWALLKHCMQHKAGYWLRNCLPLEAFAEAVDATILAAVERVLGVSFDPSTYGTATNPVVTDFLAEFLHDPDPMAAELGSVLGRGSFNATSSARQYDYFLNDAHGSDSYAAEMREAWGRLQAATAGHLGNADARVMEREVEAASGSQKELTAFLDHANNSRLRNEVCALPATCRERILFNQLDAASGMWTVAIPTARTVMTPHELREVAAGYFLLPSPCLAPVVGSQIILPSTEHNPVTVDLYGDALMNLPAPGDAHWRVPHDAIADALRDHCVHDLGIAVRREVDDLFQQAVPLGNTVPRDELKDLVPDGELSLQAFNVVTGSYDPRSLKSTLLEFKTMRYGVKYTAMPRATAVDRFERSLLGDIQRGLAARDAAWHNTEPGQKGPLRDILDISDFTGMVFGAVGEVSKGLRRTAQGEGTLYFLLPSPCLAPVVGSQIILPSTEHNPVTVDLYGDALMNLPAPGDAHWRVPHDAIADALRDHCVHDLGIAVRREVDDLFQQAVPLGNTVPRDELKDLVPDGELSLQAFNVVTGSYDPRSLKSTLLEFKTMRYGVKYTAMPRATAVDRFERSLLGDIQRGLAARDAAWHNTEPGQKGPLRDILDISDFTGMVFGAVDGADSSAIPLLKLHSTSEDHPHTHVHAWPGL